MSIFSIARSVGKRSRTHSMQGHFLLCVKCEEALVGSVVRYQRNLALVSLRSGLQDEGARCVVCRTSQVLLGYLRNSGIYGIFPGVSQPLLAPVHLPYSDSSLSFCSRGRLTFTPFSHVLVRGEILRILQFLQILTEPTRKGTESSSSEC